MAIAFQRTDARTSTSFNLLTIAGTNTLLVIAVFEHDASVVTGVTHGGTPLTLLLTVNGLVGTINLYGLLSPAAGTQNVTVSGGISGSNYGVYSWGYSGVLQSGLPDAINSFANNVSGITPLTLNVVANNCWILAFAATDYTSLRDINLYIGTTYQPPLNSLSLSGAATTRVYDSGGVVSSGANPYNFETTGLVQTDAMGILLSIAPIPTSASPSISPSASVSPSFSPSISPSPSPGSSGYSLQTVHMSASDTSGTVQQLNVGKDDDGSAIYYELETQELEFSNRAIVKLIQDKLGIASRYANDSKIEIISDDNDPIPINIDMGKRINTITLPQLKGHYITLRWSGNSTTKSPVLEGFYLNKIKDDGYG